MVALSSRKITLRLPGDLHARAVAWATQNHLSLNTLVLLAMTHYLATRKGKVRHDAV